MKSKSFNLAVALLLCALLGPAAFFLGRSTGRPGAGAPKTLYTCGMHPTVIRDAPGNCPICGMKLTPVRNQDTPAASAAITIDPATAQNMNLRTAVLTNGPLRRIVRSVGVVDFNEASLADITTRFKGWIEKLHVDTTGTLIHQGDPLFEIYSPELYSAQTDYVLALQQGAGGSATLKSSALTRLQFFGISPGQIAELERSRQPRKTLTVTASREGTVLEKMAVEGQMVDAGMRLYRIADLSLVWVVAQVYEQDLPFLTLGQEATVQLSYFPDREFRGRITYIYPTLDEKTRTARVRVELHNPGYFLKPGMFATVSLRAELEPSVLLVPDMAVLRSGDRDTVFIALDGGRFEARTVTLGPRAEHDEYQVLSGLNAGERVVVSGQFMLDSESQLREAIQKFEGPRKEPGIASAGPANARAQAAAASFASTNTVVYLCPMPEHVAIQYAHPGKCPICGMALVPVAEQTLAKLPPGGHVEHYTCPMTDACPVPGHGAIKYEKPGKCPVCGMTLIPVMTPLAVSPPKAAPGPVAPLPRLYACPMHLEVVSDKPGKCPKCEMDLVLTTEMEKGAVAEENWRKQQATNSPAVHQH